MNLSYTHGLLTSITNMHKHVKSRAGQQRTTFYLGLGPILGTQNWPLEIWFLGVRDNALRRYQGRQDWSGDRPRLGQQAAATLHT